MNFEKEHKPDNLINKDKTGKPLSLAQKWDIDSSEIEIIIPDNKQGDRKPKK